MKFEKKGKFCLVMPQMKQFKNKRGVSNTLVELDSECGF